MEVDQPEQPKSDVDLGKLVREVQAGVAAQDGRQVSRAVRTFFVEARRELTAATLLGTAARFGAEMPGEVKGALEACAVEEKAAAGDEAAGVVDGDGALTAEGRIFLALVAVVYLVDRGRAAVACGMASEMAGMVGDSLSRSGNALHSRVFFYYARAMEEAGRDGETYGVLHGALRAATLRHDHETAAVALNMLLRSYVARGLLDMADKLTQRVEVDAARVSSNQLARYHYYVGRVRVTLLDHAGARESLQEAQRKMPQHGALGFRLAVTKLTVVVQLLMGEVPERATFRAPGLRHALLPYMRLAAGMHAGDVDAFRAVVKEHEQLFSADQNLSLVQQVHHNVLKLALRKINMAYSAISLADIATKLSLRGPDEAEFVVAKAIRDGIIDAELDHQTRCMRSAKRRDVYASLEPREAFHSRTLFCLQLHNDAVRAMRFAEKRIDPPKNDDDKVDIDAVVSALEDEDDDLLD